MLNRDTELRACGAGRISFLRLTCAARALLLRGCARDTFGVKQHDRLGF